MQQGSVNFQYDDVRAAVFLLVLPALPIGLRSKHFKVFYEIGPLEEPKFHTRKHTWV